MKTISIIEDEHGSRGPQSPLPMDALLIMCDGEHYTVYEEGDQLPPPMTVTDYIPVSQTVAAHQLRVWLIKHATDPAQIDAAIDAIPEETERRVARAQWEYAPTIRRAHPLVAAMAAALGMGDGEVDQAFREAAAL